MKNIILKILCLVFVAVFLAAGCGNGENKSSQAAQVAVVADLKQIPQYSGKPYAVINDNKPVFDKKDFSRQTFEKYSPLDKLGRCGVAYANVGLETMPKEKRGSISEVKPSGWMQAKYDFVDGKSLYNRCHLIGWQLTAENANKENLITGTRYLNVDGMLPFENMVADYIKETKNHVLYRVTPVFSGNNLVADGVQMEAQSVEDNGAGISFNVYCYNVQPGVEIDYATGKSRLIGEHGQEGKSSATGQRASVQAHDFVLNTGSKKFHLPSCSGVKNIHAGNRQEYKGTRENLLKDGYTPCGICKP